jgi:hypothetical protein
MNIEKNPSKSAIVVAATFLLQFILSIIEITMVLCSLLAGKKHSGGYNGSNLEITPLNWTYSSQ